MITGTFCDVTMADVSDVWNLIVHNFWALMYWFEALFRLFVSPPQKSVDGKVVLVTGAGNGIGK